MRLVVAVTFTLLMLVPPSVQADGDPAPAVPPGGFGHPLLGVDPVVWFPVLQEEGYRAAVEAARGNATETLVDLAEAGDADGDGHGDHLLVWTHREIVGEEVMTIRQDVEARASDGRFLWSASVDGEEGLLIVFGDVDEDGVADIMRGTYVEDGLDVAFLSGRDGSVLWETEERVQGSSSQGGQGTPVGGVYTFDGVFRAELVLDRWDDQPGVLVIALDRQQSETYVVVGALLAFGSVGAGSAAVSSVVGVRDASGDVWRTQPTEDRVTTAMPVGDLDGDGHDDFVVHDVAGTTGAVAVACAVVLCQVQQQSVPGTPLVVDFVSGADGSGWSHDAGIEWDYALVSGAGDLRGQGGELAVVLIRELPTGYESDLVFLDAATGDVVAEHASADSVPVPTPWPDIDGDGDDDLILVDVSLEEVRWGPADESLEMTWSIEGPQVGPFAWSLGLPPGPTRLPDLTGDGVPDLTFTDGHFFEPMTVQAYDTVSGEKLWETGLATGFSLVFVPDIGGDGIDEALRLAFVPGAYEEQDARLELLRGSDLKPYWSKLVHSAADDRTIEGPVLHATADSDADGDGLRDLFLDLNTVFSLWSTCTPDGCTSGQTTDPWTSGFVVASADGRTLSSYQSGLPASGAGGGAEAEAVDVIEGELAPALEVPQKASTPAPAVGLLLLAACVAAALRRP